jgi:hypothetical protein
MALQKIDDQPSAKKTGDAPLSSRLARGLTKLFDADPGQQFDAV